MSRLKIESVGKQNYITMKIKNVLLFAILTVLLSCSAEQPKQEELLSEVQFSVEDYGRYHNESILSVLNSETSKISFNSIGELISTMEAEMKQLHPKEFSNVDYTPIHHIFDVNQHIKDFKYDDLFFERLKELAATNGAEVEMIEFLNNAYYNNDLLSGEFSKFISTSKNNSAKEQMAIFESFYNASEELWTKTAPEKFLVNSALSSKECDPQSQVIIADAVVGFVAALFTGPGGVLAGGGASLLVRTAQVEENGGGCI